MTDAQTIQMEMPPKLIDVFMGDARYRGSFGGRGSGKTRTFAKMTAVWALRFAQAGISGVILCGREFVKSLEESSFAEVKAAIESEPWLMAHFEVGETFIRTRDKRVSYVFAGLRHNLASIKSKARILLCWIDEAEPVTEKAWQVLIPTIREEGSDWESEIWVTWNPELENSATDKRFRKRQPHGSKIVEMNYRDNPWFPAVLDRERQDDLELRPDNYDHIWEGGYITTVEGAYFAKHLVACREDGRICNFSPDPLLTIKVHVDIGGTGKKADHFSMVVDQFSGEEIHILDHYTAQGQTGQVHLRWLTRNGYGPDVAEIILPHDGDSQDKVYDVSYKKFFEEAGYEVTVIPNQGTGAAQMRIEQLKLVFPRLWFNERKTVALLKSLGWYHEKIDPERQIGLGPEHDWCLAAGTQILTPVGWRNVEDIDVHDQVLTPRGARSIIRSGIVRETSEWTLIRGIRCTPEHRFFTSRGLVRADELSSQDQLWTQGNWGLRILACLSAAFRSGLKEAIISATPEVKPDAASGSRSSYIGWYMRLLKAQSLQVTRSIMQMMTRSITTPTTSKLSLNSNTEASISRDRDMFAFAGFVAKSSAAIKNSAQGVAPNASASTMQGLSVNAGPAYNLTVDVDHCYFVRGADGLAYLVSNSSHDADATGLMAITYEEPSADPNNYEEPEQAWVA